jgi:hypothetical protein
LFWPAERHRISKVAFKNILIFGLLFLYTLDQYFGGVALDTQAIIEALETQAKSIAQAIAALRGGNPAKRGPEQTRHGNKGRRLSPAARKRISAGMKKRWAERKKKEA